MGWVTEERESRYFCFYVQQLQGFGTSSEKEDSNETERQTQYIVVKQLKTIYECYSKNWWLIKNRYIQKVT